MFNIEMEYMKSYAKIAAEALYSMSLVWEQMQFNDTEPDILNIDYPFNESFDEVVYNINRQFNIYNKGHAVPYELSISIGYSKADLKKYSVDDLMNDIDKKMYLDKEKRKQENKG